MRPSSKQLRQSIIALAVAAIMAVAGTRPDQAKAPPAAAPASKRSTWGQILILGDEKEGRRHIRYVAELYDPASNRFSARRPAMDEGRAGETATVIPRGPNAGKILVAGGFGDKSGPLASTEIYNPGKNAFVTGPEMSIDRDNHTATAIPLGPKAGWILLSDGGTSDLYDPFTNTFAPGPRLLHERNHHTATVIPAGPNAGKILFVGGLGLGGASDPADLYDPVTNSFAAGPTLRVGRLDSTATIIASGPNAGKILIAGGWMARENEPIVSLASTELYDPATNRFLRGPSMWGARSNHTATTIPSGPRAGMILIAGGKLDDRHPLSSTELYDPATNSFARGPAMRLSRTDHCAIPIVSGPNAGKILIAGGWGKLRGQGLAALATTELYDPTTNTFVPGPLMHDAPGDTVAVQVPPAPPPRSETAGIGHVGSAARSAH